VLRRSGGNNSFATAREFVPCGGTGRQPIKRRANSMAGFNDLKNKCFSGRCSISRQRWTAWPWATGQKVAGLLKN
jgi:hypothetical protein